MNIKHLTVSTMALLLACGPALADTSLADAIKAGERAQAMTLLQRGGDVNARLPDGATALMWAVYNVDHELVEALLRKGADANASNAYDATPLTTAVDLGDAGMVRMLLDAGADPDSANRDGQTALMLASRLGVHDVAQMLVQAGADVNAVEAWRGQTALMWAAAGRHADIVRLLVENGADTDVRALHNDWGSQVTSEPRAQYRPSGGLTALLYAVREGCHECAVAIVEAGADIEMASPDGISPLLMAIDNFSYDTADYLLDQGADPNRWDWWGRTPLYIAVDMNSFRPGRGGFGADGPNFGREQPAAGSKTPMDLTRRLLAMGVDPNPQLNLWRPSGHGAGRFVDDSLTVGVTPLFVAALQHDNDIIPVLLEAGADPNIPNVMGITPLMSATGMGLSTRDSRGDYIGEVQPRAVATLELLVAAGADVNARVNGTLTRTGRIARISTMTDKEGQTAMYSCAQWGWEQVCSWLLDNGGQVAGVTDALGKTPVDAAMNRAGGRETTAHEDIVQMYIAAGGTPSATVEAANATTAQSTAQN